MAKAIDLGHIKGPVFIPNCATVRVIWQLSNGKQAHNILHGSYTAFSLTTQTAVNTLYTAIGSALTSSAHVGDISNTTQLLAIGVRDMAQVSPGVGHGEIISNLAAIVGTGGTNPLPPNVSFVVSLKTGLSLQANRGRVYLPGYDEAVNVGVGIISDTAKNNSVQFVSTVAAAMHAQGLELCIAHPARAAYDGDAGAHHPARDAGTVLVTSMSALNNVWDSTRLRSIR